MGGMGCMGMGCMNGMPVMVVNGMGGMGGMGCMGGMPMMSVMGGPTPAPSHLYQPSSGPSSGGKSSGKSGGGDTKSTPREGDWTCPGCGNVNWEKRDVCNTRKCQM